ncbi:hypothetical protein [Actinomadura sp. KC06]|uniref:hypothetical protein n=1 Tax=Actinomadura sp. KC06 TaxID=2530369 RepID=UPI001404BBB9|nr:hypothetical protein [Actinomadura sp. KC06]
MVEVTFRAVKAGMGKRMRGELEPGLRDDVAGEAVGTRRAERITEMGDAACSGRVTLYGGVV